MLINNGAIINAVDRFKNTPLHNAASGETNGHYAVVDLLIQHGADVNAVEIQNGTPLDFASFHRSKFLLIITNKLKLMNF